MVEKAMLNEEAWIEEVKRRKALKEPGIPAEKFKLFQHLLSQRLKETGSLEPGYVDQLLQSLKRGEL